jgi:hypothetical protein
VRRETARRSLVRCEEGARVRPPTLRNGSAELCCGVAIWTPCAPPASRGRRSAPLGGAVPPDALSATCESPGGPLEQTRGVCSRLSQRHDYLFLCSTNLFISCPPLSSSYHLNLAVGDLSSQKRRSYT